VQIGSAFGSALSVPCYDNPQEARMDLKGMAVIFAPAALGKIEAKVVDERGRTLAAGIGHTPPQALLAAALRWEAKQ
jgi:hypothetical protein